MLAMELDMEQKLRENEGKVLRITSTEGEVMSARVLHVSKEYGDVVIDILSTNRPERYEEMGKEYKDGSWAIPFEFIAKIEADES